MSDELRVLSLGAGRQSSALALMSANGEAPKVDVGIFADTGDETEGTYKWLGQLEQELPFPILRVSKGQLSFDFLNAIKSGGSSRCGQPPYFVRNPDSDGTTAADSGGMLWRKCTSEYKLQPIRKKIREISYGRKVVQYIGISVDEAHRMKDSGVKYITNEYPLVDQRISAKECVSWLNSKGFPAPPKSACWHCPYHSDSAWKEMRSDAPMDYAKACNYDDKLRTCRATKLAAGIKGEIFVHRKMIPLRDAINRSVERDDMQPSLFGNECEGMCGV